MVFAVAQPRLAREGEQAGAGPSSGFALMGADLLLTSDLNPVLLEINSLPSLARKVGAPCSTPTCCAGSTPPSSFLPSASSKSLLHTQLDPSPECKGFALLPAVLPEDKGRGRQGPRLSQSSKSDQFPPPTLVPPWLRCGEGGKRISRRLHCEWSPVCWTFMALSCADLPAHQPFQISIQRCAQERCRNLFAIVGDDPKIPPGGMPWEAPMNSTGSSPLVNNPQQSVWMAFHYCSSRIQHFKPLDRCWW